jgi:hypothetical protein
VVECAPAVLKGRWAAGPTLADVFRMGRPVRKCPWLADLSNLSDLSNLFKRIIHTLIGTTPGGWNLPHSTFRTRCSNFRRKRPSGSAGLDKSPF